MSYSSFAIANYFIQKGVEENKPLSHLELQKLVYIAHGWYMAYFDAPLVSEKVEAWLYGPVFPELYQQLKKNGNKKIIQSLCDEEIEDLDTLNILDEVYKRYGYYTGAELVAVTHQPNSPWDESYVPLFNATIRVEKIRQHYKALKNERRLY